MPSNLDTLHIDVCAIVHEHSYITKLRDPFDRHVKGINMNHVEESDAKKT